MEVRGGGGGPTAEELIEKIKEDGDFDRLRRNIVSNLKSSDALRSYIVSTVRQSRAVARVRDGNIKPRQLFDAVHREIRDQVMDRISDAVWDEIRSKDGMGMEIRATVENVFEQIVAEKQKSLERTKSRQNIGGPTNNALSPSIHNSSTQYQSINKEPQQPCVYTERNQTQGERAEEATIKAPALSGGRVCDYSTVTDEPLQSLPIQEVNQEMGDGESDPDVPPGFG